MNIVPFVGPWVVIPAGLLALIQDPVMLIWVSLITLIAQQIESNFNYSKRYMGQSLALHRYWYYSLVLAAGNIAGFLGILVAIPTYAVIKTIIQNIWRYRTNLKIQ